MDSALSPREIQARIRAGATLDDVAADAGVDAARLVGFAGPVLAEREHMAGQALASTIRRRGESGSHRRLGELIRTRLQARGIDADQIGWDAYRQGDLKWRVTATLATDPETRTAEFVFDPRGRFAVADNSDARWMIGEELAGSGTPDEENTVDLNDELALVRAVAETETPPADLPGDDIPSPGVMYEATEDTSQLDELYDLLSGISEDSVRIYTGIDEEPTAPAQAEPEPPVAEEQRRPETEPELEEPIPVEEPQPRQPVPEAPDPAQEALIETPEAEPAPKPAKRKRAHIPSWDEIMFGAPRGPGHK